jgi:cytochrome P450
MALKLIDGSFAHDVKALHDQYGDVVRIAPNQLSFIHPDAWKDIYNYSGSKPHFTKDLTGYPRPVSGVPSFQVADDATWSVHRRLLAHGFSEKALREQWLPLLEIYTEKLLMKLNEQIKGPSCGTVDIVKWLNFTTFDLTADMTFGESLKCLDQNDYHPWVALVFDSLKAATTFNAARLFPTFSRLLDRLIPQGLQQKAVDHFNLSVQWTNQRLASDSTRPDLVMLLRNMTGGKGLSIEEVYSDVPILILAGSETTATALSGCIYWLCRYPDAMKKLKAELHANIVSIKDINAQRLSQLEYLNAVLNEALRMYVPVPGFLPRLPPQGGMMAAGTFIPENVSRLPHSRCIKYRPHE